jgi:hypothetical protein
MTFKYPDEQWRRMEEVVERAGGAITKETFNARRAAFEEQVAEDRQGIGNWNGYSWFQPREYTRVEKAAGQLQAALDDMDCPEIFFGNDLLWKTPERLEEPEITDEDWEGPERAKNLDEFRKAVEHLLRKVAMKEKAVEHLLLRTAMMEKEWDESQRAANLKRYDGFREVLDHIRRRAAMMEERSNGVVVFELVKKRSRKRKFHARDFFIWHLGFFWREELRLRVSPSPRSRFVQFVEIASESVYDCRRDTIANIIRKRFR